MQDKIIINDYIENDPLSEENLNKTLETVNRFRLLFPNKSIWLYSGFYWEEIYEPSFTDQSQDWINKYLIQCEKRKQIISKCDVMVDGRYIDSQRDITLKWRGSDNQRVISVKESLKQRKVILHCN